MNLLLRQSWTHPVTELVPRTRRLARAAIAARETPIDEQRLDDIELVVGELLANAVVYAAPPLTIELTERADRVRVEVTDSSPDLLLPSPPEAARVETGRGLMLTAALSSNWGWHVDAHSKSVWAEFAV